MRLHGSAYNFDSISSNIDKIKVGDTINYTANDYSDCEVLSSDKDDIMVDVISGIIVKNLTLDGKDDYKNYETILQSEVDKYKIGSNVLRARLVSIEDFDNLKLIKDAQQAKFILNNKKEYRLNIHSYNFTYACAIGSYDVSAASLKYEWTSLADTLQC